MQLKAIIPLIVWMMMGLACLSQTTTQNYVQTLTARDTISGALIHEQNYPQKVQADVVYIDGLGRTIQAVMQGASPTGKDLIKMHTYDPIGRQDKDYLPFEASSTSGAYQINVGAGQQGFYANPPTGVATNSYPYSQTLFESSPLNRPLETSAPGTAWRSSLHGGTHTVDYAYRFNTVADEIRLITVDQSLGQTMTATTDYAANQLRGTMITDEDGKKRLEFTDKAGKVICKINAVGTADETYTYYVYDNRDLLTFVIPPQAVAEIGANWNLLNDVTFRKQWLFRYQYDHRNRMVEKQVPGAEKVEMVYDKRDRLVMTLDGNRRDVATVSGTNSSGNVEYVENGELIVENYQGKSYVRAPGAKIRFKKPDIYITKAQDFSARKATSAITNENQWLYTKYDALNRPVMTGIISSALNRQEVQTLIDTNNNYDFSVDYIGDANGNIHGYDDTSYPQATGTQVLTVTYYDNYDFVTDFTWGTNYTYSDHHPNTIGMVTGSLTLLLDDHSTSTQAKHLKVVTYYDDRLRPKAQMTENYFGNVDEVVTTYKNDVVPLVASTRTKHRKDGSITTVDETFTYDHRDRLLTHTHAVVGNGTKTLASNAYNALGQLIEKDLHDDGSPAQSVDYRYNERGWLTTINGGSGTFDDGNDQFGMELKYDDAPNPQYNGNIAQWFWKTNGGGQNENEQLYQYSYDALNRITNAGYGSTDKNGYFAVGGISYDLNGNLLSLTRRSDFIKIDELDYYYEGNQLIQVEDSRSATKGFKDLDSPVGTIEYTYDDNGNMITDTNKGITNIQYNYLNLPQQVTLTDNTKIHYTYDAAGIKHRKTVDDGSPETTTYSSGFHYKDNAIQFVQHAEGRARYNSGSWLYEYNLTDHLGNVRVSVNESGSVVQRQDYYPFGLTFNSSAESPENLYKYNGKEEQKETGWYDYGARMHDPWLGRWMVVDPMSEELYHLSPYNYAENNPLRFIDPDGMLSTDVIDNGDGTYDVVGGDVNDGDKGIYVVAQNDDGSYSRTGERIGESVTTHSFYNADTQDPESQQGWQGTIDTNSTESGDLVEGFKSDAENESIVSYMPNATDGEKYDFKRNGNPDNNDRDNHHRGSLWGVKEDGTKVYGSARDAGNYAAGYISGLKGLGWEAAKLGFNTLEFVKSGSLEGAQSTLAQKLGHTDGKSVRQSRTTSLPGFGPGIPIIKK
ncbi:MAG: DUF6443 domain-containing protein [Cytophagales bacterium]|nr:DUF6443 domain-containing protein [Cytophagales bacterium]